MPELEERTFLGYLDRVRPEVNERIVRRVSDLDPQHDLDGELAALLGHGKRLRAGVAVLAFDAFSDDPAGRSVALDLSAAIELAHSASLILDDMLDEDERRRGLPALHISKGQKTALLDAIGLLSMPYSIAARHGESYVEGLARTQRRMVGGALAELLDRPGASSFRSYQEVITRKTGDLFGLAARFGSAVAGCLPPVVERMERFGVSLGRVMQVADDIADLRPSPSGKRTLGAGSERLLLRCVADDCACVDLDSVLARAIHEASSALELLDGDGTGARFSAWMPVLGSSPSEIARLMLGEGRVDPPRPIGRGTTEPPGIKPK